MKNLSVAAGAVAIAAFVAASPVFAADPQPAGRNATAQQGAPSTGHWEWQYHYVGHHPRYQGDWVWVK